MKHILFILITLFIFSCASNPIAKAPKNFKVNSAKGLIAGTISIIDGHPKYNEYALHYRDKTSIRTWQHKIKIKPDRGGFVMTLKPDYKIKDTLVFQYILEHSPGDYEFINYSLFNNAGAFSSTKSSKKNFSISFKVKQGEISYLGDLILIPYKTKDGYLFEWKNKLDRESAKFKDKFPLIDWSNIVNRTPTKGKFKSESDFKFKD